MISKGAIIKINQLDHILDLRVSTTSVKLNSLSLLGAEMDLSRAYILLPLKISMIGLHFSDETLFALKNNLSSST